MDAKLFREKMETLYKGVDHSDKKQNDTYLITQDRKSILCTEHSLTFGSEEQAHEIFWKCWGEDRGELLYKKLAKEYRIGTHAIISLVRGSSKGAPHIYCPVEYATLEKMKGDWDKKYKFVEIILKTPGKDLLNKYDVEYKKTSQYEKVNIAWKLALPSVVYHCRFGVESPTSHTVRDYCDSIGIPRLRNDLGQYKKILYKSFPWLVNTNSVEHTFDSYDALARFFKEKNIPGKWSRQRAWEKKNDGIGFRSGDPIAGWIIQKGENNE
jgi:hypothetical protein